MKHLNFLSKSSSWSMGHRVTTLASTVGSPSAHRREAMLRLLSVLVLVLTFGVGNVWGVETAVYTFQTAQNGSNTGYGSNYDVTINSISWSVPGNQNFKGYVRIGGKSLDKVNRVIKSNGKITQPVTKITFNHKGKSNNSLTVHSIKLTVASDASFNTVIDEQTATPSISTSTTGSFNFTPTSPAASWAKDMYYKFTINVSNSNGSNNYGLDVSSIVFYKETFTVAYNSNEGSGTMTDSNSPYLKGSTVTVKTNTFTRSGFAFDHWDTKADDSGTDYAESATFNISENTTLYAQWESTAPACSHSIELSEGTATNGTINTISEDDLATCSETASDRRVTVTITPDACFNAPDALIYTGDGTASKVSKTDNGDGTFSYVYQFAQNDNGSGTFGVTCTAKSAGKTVNFDAGPGIPDDASLTEDCAGAGVTLPGVDVTGVCKGWNTFVGWRATAITDSMTTNAGTILTAGSKYVPTSDGETLYAVYSKVKSGGTAEETASVTISDYATAHSWGSTSSSGQKVINIDANITATASDGGNTGKFYTTEWRFYQTENATLTISAATGCTLKSATFTYGINNTGVLKDGNTTVFSGSAYSISGTSKTFSVGNSGSATNGQVKFTDISITYDKPSSTTYYCSDPNCCTSLGQINGSFFWTTHFCPAWPAKHRS